MMRYAEQVLVGLVVLLAALRAGWILLTPRLRGRGLRWLAGCLGEGRAAAWLTQTADRQSGGAGAGAGCAGCAAAAAAQPSLRKARQSR
jgi:hypothetical protein